MQALIHNIHKPLTNSKHMQALTSTHKHTKAHIDKHTQAARTSIHRHTQEHTSTHKHTQSHTIAHKHSHIYIQAHTSTHTYTYNHIQALTHSHTGTYKHMQAHAITHTHTTHNHIQAHNLFYLFFTLTDTLRTPNIHNKGHNTLTHTKKPSIHVGDAWFPSPFWPIVAIVIIHQFIPHPYTRSPSGQPPRASCSNHFARSRWCSACARSAGVLLLYMGSTKGGF